MDVDVINDAAIELLVANAAEAYAIEEAAAVEVCHHHNMPAAHWSQMYMRLLVEQREASYIDAWRAASNAATYDQALERLHASPAFALSC